MGRKRAGNGKSEMRGSLHCALRASVGMTEYWGGAEENRQQQERNAGSLHCALRASVGMTEYWGGAEENRQRQEQIRRFWLRQNDDSRAAPE